MRARFVTEPELAILLAPQNPSEDSLLRELARHADEVDCRLEIRGWGAAHADGGQPVLARIRVYLDSPSDRHGEQGEPVTSRAGTEHETPDGGHS